ncbi:NAD(P)-dependent alcohol dehydrogenase [Bythopirellula goksoeyrii]|uniref:D-xylulose reductase n=1 Tax=Bythopirellula goksoeyrii TaxID=1400387 RepID=A0A5B9Q8E9_9BACT|nr:NAD(P)-dependent alcohol dehydrogenase [Bythopirellula goksoeyrii]QEG33939.1 D-xylulose reductase [Bythopirellula goksoeyrii]
MSSLRSMPAIVLEKARQLELRSIDMDEQLGDLDVRIRIHTVGICGSDVHYYQHGRIGPFVVKAPMVLGHEASGTVVDAGSMVSHLKIGDRVCMEPGIPDPNSKATRLGIYNLDPAVRFWATPPVHGCLRPEVVHPATFTFKIPENVSFAEAAMVEPLAVGMHAVNKSRIRAGDLAVVMGAGPIGMVTAIAALAAGASRVIITDVQQEKLDLAEKLGPIRAVNITKENLASVVDNFSDGWGAEVVFEASGNARSASSVFDTLCPGGTVVFIGMPNESISYDVVGASIKEARVEHVFRYAHVYPSALKLMASGKIDVKPLITDTFDFEDGIKAFEYAANMSPSSVKAQIVLVK